MFKNRSSEPEIMDDLNYSGEVVIQTLRELDIINKWLGGNAITLQALKRVFKEKNLSGDQTPVKIADLGCGSGYIMKLVAEWARRNQVKVELTGIDANPTITDYAKSFTKDYPEITYQTINVFSEEFKKQHFDIITSTLFFHHFPDEELTALLAQLKQQTRIAIIINDIHRHWLAFHSIKWLTHAFSKSYMVKYDAKLSVLRAFTKSELERIIPKAGFKQYEISWKWAFRYQVILSC